MATPVKDRANERTEDQVDPSELEDPGPAEKLYLRRGAAISEGGAQIDVPEDLEEEIIEAAREYNDLQAGRLPNRNRPQDVMETRGAIRRGSLDQSKNPYEGSAKEQREKMDKARAEFDPGKNPSQQPAPEREREEREKRDPNKPTQLPADREREERERKEKETTKKN